MVNTVGAIHESPALIGFDFFERGVEDVAPYEVRKNVEKSCFWKDKFFVVNTVGAIHESPALIRFDFFERGVEDVAPYKVRKNRRNSFEQFKNTGK